MPSASDKTGPYLQKAARGEHLSTLAFSETGGSAKALPEDTVIEVELMASVKNRTTTTPLRMSLIIYRFPY